jgi:hypothetical protein
MSALWLAQFHDMYGDHMHRGWGAGGSILMIALVAAVIALVAVVARHLASQERAALPGS